jgi:hypothetical protein
MEKRNVIELPRWPSGGNRRALEESWLEQLEPGGLSAFMPEIPTEPPEELYKAVEEFNSRLFWECHETLEEVWRETPYPLRFFYHAIIKAAVGFHHLSRHNRHGARVKLSDAVRLLPLFQPHFLGVRTDLLLGDASEWLSRLDADGPVNWHELDALPRPTIGRLTDII